MSRDRVELPADLADPFHPNVQIVLMPRDARTAIGDYLEHLGARRADCPACEHSPHPTDARLEELAAMPYAEYLRSQEWRRTRRAKLHQADYHCRRCQQRNATMVHHLIYDHIGHEWLDELVALCDPCHDALHEDRDRYWKKRRRRK